MASNEFTTTWSYSTSDSPERAGFMSDVFVVPNLNMAYEIVYQVHWSNDICSPVRELIGTDKAGKNVTDWPSDVIFDVKSEKNKASLSFYSRFQLQDQKIPELNSTLANLDRKLNGKECKLSDTDELCTQRRVVKAGLDGWSRAIKVEEEGKGEEVDGNVANEKGKVPIENWFTSHGKRDMIDYRPLDLDEQAKKQSSSLISPLLSDSDGNSDRKPVSLDNGLIPRDSTLSSINRIQFDGGAGQLDMTMSKQKAEEYHSISCWMFCNTQTDVHVG